MSKRRHTPRIDTHERMLLYIYRVIPPESRHVVDQQLWRQFLTPAEGPEKSAKGDRERTEMLPLRLGRASAEPLFNFKSYWPADAASEQAGGAQ